jgi:hypothetical protein
MPVVMVMMVVRMVSVVMPVMVAIVALRDIKKDKSGNPGGRPRQLASVMHEARRYTFEAIRTLLKLMRTAESE